MKIVFLDAQTMGDVPNLAKLQELGEFVSYPLTVPSKRLERIADCTVAITCKVIIDKEIIDNCPGLRLICVAATGTNNVDVEYAHSKGIAVKNVAAYSTESVAQITIGMLLSLVNKIHYYDNYVKSAKYAESDMFTHYGPAFNELKGKTAGIIGLGNIGRRVAEIMHAFGMKIIYYSTSGNNNNAGYKRCELDELLESSDIISIHCPLNDQTRNLISLPQLEKMKKRAVLINVARGGIIHEQDLVLALNNKVIAGFGTDVYEKEPMSIESPYFNLKSMENVLFSPHMAWTSLEARTVLIEKVYQNILDYMSGN